MEETTVTNTTTDTNQPDYLPDAYNELCSSYHAIDDFRTKLLGFLPLVTGGGLVLLSGRAEEIRKEFFGPVGSFGILVTLGLLAYELFGIKKCHALIETGKVLEQEMGLPVGGKGKPAGQFIQRPNNLLRVVNEPFAAALIYPAVLAAWTYLALLYDNPSSTADPLRTADPSRAQRFGLYVFIGGFALVLLYDGFLRHQKKLRAWWERRRTPRAGHEQANEQPSQAVPE
jgi:hypothetical protein